jgi:hypothetical protein
MDDGSAAIQEVVEIDSMPAADAGRLRREAAEVTTAWVESRHIASQPDAGTS